MTVLAFDETMWGALSRAYGQLRSGSKFLARDAGGVSPRTAENWLNRRCTPHGESLIHLMANNREIAAEIMRLVEEARCQTQD